MDVCGQCLVFSTDLKPADAPVARMFLYHRLEYSTSIVCSHICLYYRELRVSALKMLL